MDSYTDRRIKHSSIHVAYVHDSMKEDIFMKYTRFKKLGEPAFKVLVITKINGQAKLIDHV